MHTETEQTPKEKTPVAVKEQEVPKKKDSSPGVFSGARFNTETSGSDTNPVGYTTADGKFAHY